MRYYILNKTHIVNNLLVDEPIGYLTNMDNALLINYKYETTYFLWVNNNKTDLEKESRPNRSAFCDKNKLNILIFLLFR